MKNASATKASTKLVARKKSDSPKFDWRRFDSLTDEEIHKAALSDPDAQPLTDADMKRMKRTPQVKVIRRVLRLSQEEFARAFEIPIGTLRDWEQGRVEPDQAARAYLRVIAHNPDVVRIALERRQSKPTLAPGLYERESESLRAYKAAAAKRLPWLLDRMKETMRELGSETSEDMTVGEVRKAARLSAPKGRGP